MNQLEILSIPSKLTLDNIENTLCIHNDAHFG